MLARHSTLLSGQLDFNMMNRHVASKSVESAMTKVWINQGLSDVTTNVVCCFSCSNRPGSAPISSCLPPFPYRPSPSVRERQTRATSGAPQPRGAHHWPTDATRRPPILLRCRQRRLVGHAQALYWRDSLLFTIFGKGRAPIHPSELGGIPVEWPF